VQLIYPGGNWQPRPTALRRLAWETQKRTAARMVLEPSTTKPFLPKLAKHPLAYLSGDRSFPVFEKNWIANLKRYLNFGGTIIVDPAYTPDGDAPGFKRSIYNLFKSVLPGVQPETILPDHVIFHSFYKINRAEGMVKGSKGLTVFNIKDRAAVIINDHDLAGAWDMDNLGNWKNDVTPGGARQRENAFRLGVNIIMYTLCGDYKNEAPHKRFIPGKIQD
jgi:hypothetical protein